MKDKHLIVISVDAMVYEDLEYARTLPNLGKIIENGAVIEKVRTIYPSLTHPVHASIITGAPAGRTGIISNAKFCPGNLSAPWYNFLGEIKCDTILHAAKRKGLTTAVSTWPVTTKGEDVIDYLVPGIMNYYYNGHENDDPLDVFREYGATEELIDIIAEAIARFGKEDRHPEYDEVQAYIASEIIKKFKPNILLTHPGYVDSARHKTGLFTDAVNHSIKETDRWIGMLLDAVKEAGIEDTTDVIVLSDHGQLSITRAIAINAILAERGYINVGNQGELLSWDAYATSCGLSAEINLSRPDDKELYNSVYNTLLEMKDDGIYGFERVLKTEEANELYGLDGDFSFVIETDGFTSFSEDWRRPFVRKLNPIDYRFGRGTHGHSPEKGPQPPFIGMGPSFKKGVRVENGHILNHAPTIARILGLDLQDAEGKVVEEILND